MKKTVQITTGQLQQIIKEGVARLHKKTLIENRIQQINEEMSDIQDMVYMNERLSDYFGLPYQNDGKQTVINSGTLKRSNPDWDQKHLAIFEKYAGSDLYLQGTGYGWWRITNSIGGINEEFDLYKSQRLNEEDIEYNSLPEAKILPADVDKYLEQSHLEIGDANHKYYKDILYQGTCKIEYDYYTPDEIPIYTIRVSIPFTYDDFPEFSFDYTKGESVGIEVMNHDDAFGLYLSMPTPSNIKKYKLSEEVKNIIKDKSDKIFKESKSNIEDFAWNQLEDYNNHY